MVDSKIFLLVVLVGCFLGGCTKHSEPQTVFLTPNSVPVLYDCGLVKQIPYKECEALVSLYSYTAGDQWSNDYPGSAELWLSDDSPCGWFGITCQEGHVTKLELNEIGLKNNLPKRLTQLSELELLSVYKNDLEGSLPLFLPLFSRLASVDLSNNFYTGTIPMEWTTMKSLRALNVNHNRLTGSLPLGFEHIGIGWLDVSYNRLVGVMSADYKNLFYFNYEETDLVFLPHTEEPIPTPLPTLTIPMKR